MTAKPKKGGPGNRAALFCVRSRPICGCSLISRNVLVRRDISSYFRPMRIKLLAAISLLFLASCGASAEYEFAGQCQKIAGIEIENRALWRQYLAERTVALASVKTTVDGVEIPSTDLSPVVNTKNFDWTNDWVLRGRPNTPINEAYRDDKYITRKGTREPIARFRTLVLQVTSSDGPSGFDCLDRYPHLYTGALQRKGSITVMKR